MPLVTKTADLTRRGHAQLSSACPPRALRRVALSDVELSAATGLVRGDAGSVAELVRDRATAYATGDADVRRRALSRAAAVQEAHMQQVAALLAAAVARRDEPAVRLLDRTLTSATNRYRGLLEQLRIESVATRTVTMTAAGPVAIVAEETR